MGILTRMSDAFWIALFTSIPGIIAAIGVYLNGRQIKEVKKVLNGGTKKDV